ncbi:MAG TPA: RHS repeat-associated core domain-containing protein [Stenotrophomonas sp.]
MEGTGDAMKEIPRAGAETPGSRELKTLVLDSTRATRMARHVSRFVSICITSALLVAIGCGAVEAQTVEYLHTDLLGTPVAVTNAQGQLVGRRSYAPYGSSELTVGNDEPEYAGHVRDSLTGLSYMQQRYYDAAIGRFLSVDPVTAYDNGDTRFFNRYSYAFNSPYTFADPDGRCSTWGGFLPCPVPESMRDPAMTRADEIRGRDGRYVVGIVAGSAALGGGAAVAVETGTVAAVGRAAKSETSKRFLCAALSFCDAKTGRDEKETAQEPESGYAEDVARIAEVWGKMMERLSKEKTTIPKPKSPSTPPPPSPPVAPPLPPSPVPQPAPPPPLRIA